jgi:hypothetical protein
MLEIKSTVTRLWHLYKSCEKTKKESVHLKTG